jgi:hypothetical protein
MVIIENDGPDIIKTNFWQTDQAKKGAFFLSTNAGAFRLLIPYMHKDEVKEFETSEDVIVSRGPWPAAGLGDAIEILFDDGTDEPYSIHLGMNQIDRLPSEDNAGRECVFSVWLLKDGKPFKAYESKCLFRVVPTLPYLKGR